MDWMQIQTGTPGWSLPHMSAYHVSMTRDCRSTTPHSYSVGSGKSLSRVPLEIDLSLGERRKNTSNAI